jgi:CheY-like chemotaxis protein
MTGPSILVVEDDYLIAMQAEATLVDAGFALAGIATSADEAIAMARTHRPVLALMDIRLAGRRDGVDAALDLFRGHGIRCIFATAHADREVSSRAEPARPFAWLQKPYSMASLIDAVNKAFEEIGCKGQ